jgi:hypothetical protein
MPEQISSIPVMTVEEYAIDMVCSGAESYAGDDMNDYDDIAQENWDAAIELAYQIIRAIRANPAAILALAAQHAEETDHA